MYLIDHQSRTAVYEQLTEQTERLILTGILKPGQAMPSVRALSVELAINPNTIQKAYTELDRRGLIYSAPGRGCFVAGDAQARIKAEVLENIGEVEDMACRYALAGVEKSVFVDAVDKGYLKNGA